MQRIEAAVGGLEDPWHGADRPGGGAERLGGGAERPAEVMPAPVQPVHPPGVLHPTMHVQPVAIS